MGCVQQFVNDCLMTLGLLRCLAHHTHPLDLALCPAPPPGSLPIGPSWGQYKRGAEEWEGSRRP